MLRLENIALRHQMAVYKHTVYRLRLFPERSPVCPADTRYGVRAATNRHSLTKESLPLAAFESVGKPARPTIAKEIRELIQNTCGANRAWTSPRIVGELRKLGIEIAKSTMEKYRARQRKLPSPTWKVFLNTHNKDSVTLDFFPVAKTAVAAGNFAGRTCEDGSIASELSGDQPFSVPHRAYRYDTLTFITFPLEFHYISVRFEPHWEVGCHLQQCYTRLTGFEKSSIVPNAQKVMDT